MLLHSPVRTLLRPAPHDCSQEVICPEPLRLGCGSPSACSELGLWSLREEQRWASSVSALLSAPVSQKTLSRSVHMLPEHLLCAQHCASLQSTGVAGAEIVSASWNSRSSLEGRTSQPRWFLTVPRAVEAVNRPRSPGGEPTQEGFI